MADKSSEPLKEARAIVRYLRIGPRKVRIVINTVRRKPVGQAFSILTALKKKAARFVEKGLKSAVANAKVKGLEGSRLVVSEIKADGGPVMKRFMARAMGRADEILKRTTHLTIVLREGERSFGPPLTAKGEEKTKREKPKKEKTARQGGKPARKAAVAKA